MRIKKIKSFDDTQINLCIWDNVKKPIGIIQIFHGMLEYASRYDDIAKFFNEKGFIVYINQHRAHYEDIDYKLLGIYNGNNCFWDTVNDEIYISKLIVKKYSSLPLYIFAHSYGSFLAQAYITMSNLHNKVVLSGSALMRKSFNCQLMCFITSIQCTLFGKKYIPKLLFKMAVKIYHSKLKKEGSLLTSNEIEAKKYHDNNRCGFVCDIKFFEDFFKSFKEIYKETNAQKIDKNKPIFIVSGKDDAIGEMGKSVIKLEKYYKSLSIKNVSCKLYAKSRHEVFHDNDRNEFLNDIVNFYMSK